MEVNNSLIILITSVKAITSPAKATSVAISSLPDFFSI